MWLYITELLFFVSIGICAYLVIRKLPYIDSLEKAHEKSVSYKGSDFVHALDKRSLFVLGRFLRKFRVFVLRLDNTLAKNLDVVKKKTEEHDAPNLLKGLSAQEEPTDKKEE